MPDTKITALTALTAADPANDVLPIVDVSDTTMAASGTTKKISINNVLGASGTATLASATISGNLTVDTNTLFVDSSLNFVAIGATAQSFGEKFRINGNYTVMNDGAFTGFLGKASAIGASGSTTDFGIRSENALVFLTGGATERARIDSSGNVGVGVTPSAGGGCLQLKSGITFPATQVASSDANTLDDYEEGTWTGTITGSTTNPTTPVTATGRYTKIGQLVTVQIAFSPVDTTGASGQVRISGLPFTNNSSIASPVTVVAGQIATFTGMIGGLVLAGSTIIRLYSFASNGALADATHNAGSGRELFLHLTYTV